MAQLLPHLMYHLSIDRYWEVAGSQYGLTCPEPAAVNSSNEGVLVCKTLVIPDCADRTIYCTNPPDQYDQGVITVTKNPSLYYKSPAGILQMLVSLALVIRLK